MKYAVKNNQSYPVETEAEEKFYLSSGFDIADEDGNLVVASVEKTISYQEHLNKIKELGAKIKELEKPKK